MNQYIFEDRDAEQRRLDAQAGLFAPATERFFRASGIAEGMTVLDIGSGAGHVARLVATLVGESGSVVGVERDPIAVADASARTAAEGIRNVSFLEGDAQTLGVVDSTFDAVVGRLILMYLPDPTAAIQSAVDHLRPGGLIAMLEPDLEYPWAIPSTPLWEQVQRWFLQTLDKAGVEPRMGLRLDRCFRDVGLDPGELSLQAALLGGPTAPAWGWANLVRGVVPLMERLGVATAAEVDADTLADRLLAETTDARGAVIWPPMIGAAARV